MVPTYSMSVTDAEVEFFGSGCFVPDNGNAVGLRGERFGVLVLPRLQQEAT